MSKGVVRGAQIVVSAVIVVFLILKLRTLWHAAVNQPIEWSFHWSWVVASLAVTLLMYGVLIAGWRAVLVAWGERLSPRQAANIWTVSNLGTFIPGGIWAVAGMAVLARRRGVSAAAATGSAVVMQLLALASGISLALFLVGLKVIRGAVAPAMGHWVSAGAIALLAGCVSVIGSLASAGMVRALVRLIPKAEGLRPVPVAALGFALATNVVAWFGYGFALLLLGRGTLRGVELTWPLATGAFAAAYLLGYIVFFVPGGLGIRDAVLATVLAATGTAAPAALALAAASRVVVTINQVGAALPFLLFRSRSSDTSS